LLVYFSIFVAVKMWTKKTLLALGCIVLLAACDSNEGGKQNGAQAQLDSALNVTRDSLTRALKAQNDSIINAESRRVADSLAAAANKNEAAPRNNAQHAVPTLTPPPPPPTAPTTPRPGAH
jgi:hypothetical protein